MRKQYDAVGCAEAWIFHYLRALKDAFECRPVRQNPSTANPALEQVNRLR